MCICYGEKSGKDWQSESTSVNFSGNSSIDYSVLLQTARAQVASVDGKKSTNSRLLFDSGAQMSYVTPRVRDLLNLQTIAKKEMSIKTFGGARYTKELDIPSL